MRVSKFNIVEQVAEQPDQVFVINLLSREADILTTDEADSLLKKQVPTDPKLLTIFKKKGYVVEPDKEDTHWREMYLKFLNARRQGEVQVFFVPTYACNFACEYCYQDEYQTSTQPLNPDLIDSFFKALVTQFSGTPYYITLFGGEPLLSGKEYRASLALFFDRVRESKLSLAVVTNGYYLSEFVPTFKTLNMREVQVTLDGPPQIHDQRRRKKDGGSSFTQIAQGIQDCLDAGIQVNLRVVVDKQNLPFLPELADFAEKQGWVDHPLFKTQLGRNYELHHCQAQRNQLYDRLNLYEDLYQLLKTNPILGKFHRPAFSIARFLFEHGELPDPLFDSCPGCKTEWAYDVQGKIFACTAMVGKPGEDIGHFYPEFNLDENQVWDWDERDLLSIPGCRDCDVSLACGGGCAAVAKTKHGTLHAPDCRPVKELLALGIAHYQEKDQGEMHE